MTDFYLSNGAFCCVQIPDNPILVDLVDGMVVSSIHPMKPFEHRKDAVDYMKSNYPDWVDSTLEEDNEEPPE